MSEVLCKIATSIGIGQSWFCPEKKDPCSEKKEPMQERISVPEIRSRESGSYQKPFDIEIVVGIAKKEESFSPGWEYRVRYWYYQFQSANNPEDIIKCGGFTASKEFEVGKMYNIVFLRQKDACATYDGPEYLTECVGFSEITAKSANEDISK
jgi:hypothetical protein